MRIRELMAPAIIAVACTKPTPTSFTLEATAISTTLNVTWDGRSVIDANETFKSAGKIGV